MKRLAVLTATVVVTVLVALVLWEFRGVAVILFLSLGLAAAVRPLVDVLGQSGLPKLLGLIGTYAVVLTALGLLVVLVSGLLLADLHQLTEDSVQVHEYIAREWPHGTWLQQAVAHRIPTPEQFYAVLSGQFGITVLEKVLGTAFGVAETAVDLIVIVVLSIYWTIDRVHFERLWLSLLPLNVRTYARDLWRAAESEVGAYFRSEVVQSLMAGFALGIGYWTLGIRYPMMLASIASLAWMIPWAGGLIALAAMLLLSVPAFVLEYDLHAAAGTIVAAVYTLGVFVLLEVFIEPRFFNRHRYNSLLMVLAVMVLADNFGILGLLLGPPLAVVAQAIGERLLRQRSAPAGVPAVPIELPLGERMAALRACLASIENLPREVASLAERLYGLLAQARELLPGFPSDLAGAQQAAPADPHRTPGK